MVDDDFDRQLSDWLADGPVEAPRRPVAAAVAHARTHPRHDHSVRAFWEAAMSRMDLVQVQPSHPQRRGLLAVVGAVAVVALVVAVAGRGILSPNQPSEPAIPAVVATAAPPAATTATTAVPVATTDAVAAVAAIAGTWTGTLVEPPSAVDALSRLAYRTDKAVTFDATVDLQACTVGAGCGTLQRRTALWPPTGQPFACTFDLIFRGFYQGSAALSFGEAPAASQPKECAPAQMAVTLLTSGQAVAVEEGDSEGTFDHGVLTRSAAP